MSLTINIYYTGKEGSARKFAEEMLKSGIVDAIRKEDGKEITGMSEKTAWIYETVKLIRRE